MDTSAQVGARSRTFVRDEIWFSDGNVVLEAQGHVFKVYQGLLSHISEVFRDLFTVPQPSGMEAFDGCPLVILMDHPEDLRHLLIAIFPGQGFVSLSFSTSRTLLISPLAEDAIVTTNNSSVQPLLLSSDCLTKTKSITSTGHIFHE